MAHQAARKTECLNKIQLADRKTGQSYKDLCQPYQSKIWARRGYTYSTTNESFIKCVLKIRRANPHIMIRE